MDKYKILTYGNPLLRQIAEEVSEYNSEIRDIVNKLHEMLASDHKGIGLAATQVGIMKRIFVVNLFRSENPQKFTLINPRIIYRSRDIVGIEEGCLSVPDVWGNVDRPEKVKVKAYLPSGAGILIEADGSLARVIQHELDHLDGKLFIDYLSKEDLENNEELINEILEKNKMNLDKVVL